MLSWRVRAPCGTDHDWRVRENPAYLLAALCILADTRLGKSILVTMPYADALFGLSDWFRQLWAESLGKRLSPDNEVSSPARRRSRRWVPSTSIRKSSSTPRVQTTNSISLIAVEEYRAEVTIEDVPDGIPELDYLGRGVGQLLSGSARHGLGVNPGEAPKPDDRHAGDRRVAIGEFFFLYELQTVMAGALYGVNPFGQPGVEAGKNATYALMGRDGLRHVARRAACLERE